MPYRGRHCPGTLTRAGSGSGHGIAPHFPFVGAGTCRIPRGEGGRSPRWEESQGVAPMGWRRQGCHSTSRGVCTQCGFVNLSQKSTQVHPRKHAGVCKPRAETDLKVKGQQCSVLGSSLLGAPGPSFLRPRGQVWTRPPAEGKACRGRASPRRASGMQSLRPHPDASACECAQLTPGPVRACEPWAGAQTLFPTEGPQTWLVQPARSTGGETEVRW